MESELTRCTGGCCRKFYLPYTPVEIGSAVLKARAGKDSLEDIEQIGTMLIYLGIFVGPQRDTGDPHGGHYYTCKHFDGADCKIYDRRPRMCSRYPDSGKCYYTGCTRTTMLTPLRVDE